MVVADTSGPDEPSKNTRHRHSWPEEDVDLLLDAEAIIRSRGRNITGGSRGHAALDQIFVGWRIPSLHNVLNRIRTTDPAKGAYYTRLEEAWHNIYMSNRGTPSLPDPNPKSPQKFDLLYHINFLRKHVNKAALWVFALRDWTLTLEQKSRCSCRCRVHPRRSSS